MPHHAPARHSFVPCESLAGPAGPLALAAANGRPMERRDACQLARSLAHSLPSRCAMPVRSLPSRCVMGALVRLLACLSVRVCALWTCSLSSSLSLPVLVAFSPSACDVVRSHGCLLSSLTVVARFPSPVVRSRVFWFDRESERVDRRRSDAMDSTRGQGPSCAGSCGEACSGPTCSPPPLSLIFVRSAGEPARLMSERMHEECTEKVLSGESPRGDSRDGTFQKPPCGALIASTGALRMLRNHELNT